MLFLHYDVLHCGIFTLWCFYIVVFLHCGVFILWCFYIVVFLHCGVFTLCCFYIVVFLHCKSHCGKIGFRLKIMIAYFDI